MARVLSLHGHSPGQMDFRRDAFVHDGYSVNPVVDGDVAMRI